MTIATTANVSWPIVDGCTCTAQGSWSNVCRKSRFREPFRYILAAALHRRPRLPLVSATKLWRSAERPAWAARNQSVAERVSFLPCRARSLTTMAEGRWAKKSSCSIPYPLTITYLALAGTAFWSIANNIHGPGIAMPGSLGTCMVQVLPFC